jgi:hypothetical protein
MSQPHESEKEIKDLKEKDDPPPAAQRALAEAQARRAASAPVGGAAELGGRGGLDPARYGDWEVKGLASDF